MASKRRKQKKKRTGHELELDIDGTIIMMGPKSEERRIRGEIEERILAWLIDACPQRFGSPNNPIAGNTAFKLAWNGTFLEHRLTVARVEKLHVNYRNRRNWRQWIRIEKDRDIGRPGKPAT